MAKLTLYRFEVLRKDGSIFSKDGYLLNSKDFASKKASMQKWTDAFGFTLNAYPVPLA